MNGKPSPRILSNLWDGVPVRDHVDDVVEREEGVTLDLREHVLPHRATRQEPDQLNVVPEKTKRTLPFRQRFLWNRVLATDLKGDESSIRFRSDRIISMKWLKEALSL